MEPGSLVQGQPLVVQGTMADTQGLIQAVSAVQTNILSAAPSPGLASVVGDVQLQLPVSTNQIAAAQTQLVAANIPQSTVSQAQVAEILQWQASSSQQQQQQLTNAVVTPSNMTTILPQLPAASSTVCVVTSAVPVLSAQSVQSPSPHNTLLIYHPVAQNTATTSSSLRFVRPATQPVRLRQQAQPLTKVLSQPRPRGTPIQSNIRAKSIGTPISVTTHQVLQSLEVSSPKEAALLQRLNREVNKEALARLSSPPMTLLQPSSVSLRAQIRQKTPRLKTSLPLPQHTPQPRLLVPTQLASPSPRTVQLKTLKAEAKTSNAEAAAASLAKKPLAPGVTMVDCSQLSSLNQAELVVGQEYFINYGGGKQLRGEWDGEFFRVKPTVGVPDVKQQISSSLTSSPIRGGGKAKKKLAGLLAEATPVVNLSPQLVNLNGQVVNSTPTGKETLTRPPIRQVIAKKILQTSESSPEMKTTSQKRSFKPSEDGKFAVCNHCGNMSADYNICDGCHKELPDNPKYFVPEKSPEKIMKLDTGQRIVTRQAFYGRVMKVAPTRKTLTRPGTRAPKKQEEPEMVTILSSDDEAEEEGSVPSVPSSAASTPKCPGDLLSRTQKMEDQNGQVLKAARIPAQIPEIVKVTQTTEVKLKLRSVRIGTLRSKEADPLNISAENFQIRFTAQDKQKFNMVLATTEVVKIDACMTTKATTLFLHTTGSCGSKIRQGCKLVPGKEPYFDPCGKSECHKYIILIVDDMSKSNIMMFRQICKLIGTDNSKQEFLHEMTSSDSDQRLIACLMEESGGGGSGALQQLSRVQVAKSRANNQALLQNAFSLLVTPAKDGGSQIQLLQTQMLLAANNGAPDSMEEGEEEELMDRSRSPSPFQASFSAPIVKLFTYPPPPATGGISVTNEDLFCLNEGEFLNDVIIDFYLKYVFTEMLSEEQQQKTHLFSSFFYRRLTQKQSRRQTNEDQASMSLPERRHSRVKTWTRHVDIFSKDFIIVPINESAHWYLAIICFPWLRKPIVAAKPAKEESTPDTPASCTNTPTSNSTSENTEATQSSEASQGSPQAEEKKTPAQTKTAAKAATRSLKSNTYISQQPCILIFDSLSGLGRSGVVRTLREYIQTEWNMRKVATEGTRLFDKDNMRGANPKCPQQTNFSDCGIYVLQYVKCFFRSPIKEYGIPMNLINWFEEAEAKHKREDLRVLILGLQQELNPDLKYDPTKDGCLPELPVSAASAEELMDTSQSSS